MKKLYYAFALLITALLFMSCTKGATGPAGADASAGLIKASFVQGVLPDASYSGESDTRIYNAAAAENYGTCSDTVVGISNGVWRGLIKFGSISTYIPSNATINKAELRLYVYNIAGNTSEKDYGATKSWTEGTGGCGGNSSTGASWNYYSYPTVWQNPGGDYSLSPASPDVQITTTGQYYTFEVPVSLVQSWLSGESNNLGLLVMADDETSGVTKYFAYNNKEAGSPMPELDVYYTLN